jgi:hypothetical protein
MLRQTAGPGRPFFPTLAQIQKQKASLPSAHPPLTAQIQPAQTQPAQTQPPDPRPTPTQNPHLPEAALQGPAGQAIRAIAPHTEADPAALLLQLLTVFGNLLGRGPHCLVDATRHSLNLYLVLVGDSSKARKGTSWNHVARLFAEVDQPWLTTRITTARLTAHALTQTLRNQQPPIDHRLLALSEEFAPVLHSLKRGDANLSSLLRTAWDGGHLPSLDPSLDPSLERSFDQSFAPRQHPHPTPTHVSLIAHITHRELAQNLPRAEAHNGFANRCLWARVHRSNCLPEGGSLPTTDLLPIARELRRALDWAAVTPEILFRRDAAARDLWQDRYPTLSQLQPGLRGAATSRAEAQVLRLSAIYAALDSTPVVGVSHLEAALAVWDYCYASAALLFGMSTGDPVADRIREAIEISSEGLSRHQITRLFHGHVDGPRIEAALETLVSVGALAAQAKPTAGRPSIRWALVEATEPEENEENEGTEESLTEDHAPANEPK